MPKRRNISATSTGRSPQLVREPANPYDACAVRTDSRGRKLGYVSRGDNANGARRLDVGEALPATITAIAQQATACDSAEFDATSP